MKGQSLLARSARWATIPICLLAGLAEAQTSIYSLDDLIDRALRHNAEILAGRADVDEAQAQLRQARGAFILPRLRLESIGGLTPDAEGDVFNPPSDTSGVRDLGPFARAQLEFVQPLYTFGLLSNLHGAAKAGVEVEEAKLSSCPGQPLSSKTAGQQHPRFFPLLFLRFVCCCWFCAGLATCGYFPSHVYRSGMSAVHVWNRLK